MLADRQIRQMTTVTLWRMRAEGLLMLILYAGNFARLFMFEYFFKHFQFRFDTLQSYTQRNETGNEAQRCEP